MKKFLFTKNGDNSQGKQKVAEREKTEQKKALEIATSQGNDKRDEEKLSSRKNYEEETKFGENLDFSTSEAYNLLRTNLLFSLSAGATKGRVIGVTSPCPQEGKSYTSINLAYSIAKAGNKVLLVDGDMRKPTVAGKLNIESKVGLSNLLAGQDVNPIQKGLLHENLSILTSGELPPNPSELLGSEQMKNTLDEFLKEYDYILVDLPPVNSVSDPIIASKYLDGIVIIIKHGFSRKKDLFEAIRQLKFAGAHILGIVYNEYSSRKGYYRKRKYYHKYYDNNHYYYDSYGYYYSSDNDKEVKK